jgi:hypothetical protein
MENRAENLKYDGGRLMPLKKYRPDIIDGRQMV